MNKHTLKSSRQLLRVVPPENPFLNYQKVPAFRAAQFIVGLKTQNLHPQRIEIRKKNSPT